MKKVKEISIESAVKTAILIYGLDSGAEEVLTQICKEERQNDPDGFDSIVHRGMLGTWIVKNAVRALMNTKKALEASEEAVKEERKRAEQEAEKRKSEQIAASSKTLGGFPLVDVFDVMDVQPQTPSGFLNNTSGRYRCYIDDEGNVYESAKVAAQHFGCASSIISAYASKGRYCKAAGTHIKRATPMQIAAAKECGRFFRQGKTSVVRVETETTYPSMYQAAKCFSKDGESLQKERVDLKYSIEEKAAYHTYNYNIVK